MNRRLTRSAALAAIGLMLAAAPAAIAAECGFASHSHMTDTFRRTLGAPPSRLRAGVVT